METKVTTFNQDLTAGMSRERQAEPECDLKKQSQSEARQK
jgi:hypothetical protein